MTVIELSAIIETPEEIGALKKLMDEFKARFGTTVKLRQMGWDNAWTELLSYSLYGKETDVSHIGSTWCSSLVEMNALRPFKPPEVAQLGGSEAFLKPAWQSALVEGDTRVWSIPWTGYTNVFAFRRDLFAKAGLEENICLESIPNILQTIQSLKSIGIAYPLLLPTTGNVDLLHAAASWVWEAGGEFIDLTNRKILFTQPAALAGLRSYFELFRGLPATADHFSATQCANLFANGQAGISLVNTKSLLGILRSGTNPEIMQNFSGTSQDWKEETHLCGEIDSSSLAACIIPN